MMDDRTLLVPPDYPPYFQAVDAVTDRIMATPNPIAELWNPWTCPESALPALAWAMSVDVWDPNWPLSKRRSVVANSIRYHRLKGTLAGIRAYVGLAGGELVSAVRPPAKAFLSHSPSRAEREAQLPLLPQIRLYDAKINATRYGAYWGDEISGKWFTDSSGAPLLFPVLSDADGRSGPKAIMWRDGAEAPLTRNTTQVIGDREFVFQRGTVPAGIFSGDPMGLDPWPVESEAYLRTFAYQLSGLSESERILHRFPIPAGLTPVTVDPAHVNAQGTNPAGVISGSSFLGDDFFVPSEAATRQYDVIYLIDPANPASLNHATSFMGDDRFGIDDFTAELKVSVTGKREIWTTNEFVYGFFYARPKDDLAKVLDAIVAAKSARDKILVQPRTYRPLSVGTTLLVGGNIIVGEFTRS